MQGLVRAALASSLGAAFLACAFVACGIEIRGSASPEPDAAGAGDRANVPSDPGEPQSVPEAGAELDATAPGPDATSPIEEQPYLKLAHSVPPADVDLSAEGTLGWAHWGYGEQKNAFNQRADGVGRIPTFGIETATGAVDLRGFDDYATSFRWTGGSPRAQESGCRYGVYCKGDRPKFSLAVPLAANDSRELVLYVGGYKARAELVVRLAHASDPPPVSALYDVPDGNGYARYAIGARSSVATQILVTWTMTYRYDVNNSNVTLAAATLR